MLPTCMAPVPTVSGFIEKVDLLQGAARFFFSTTNDLAIGARWFHS